MSLKATGIKDAELDEYGYVYATIPATTDKDVPVICYCAHVDTAPDVTGTNVKPILHKSWDGSDIVLPDDNNIVISKKDHPYLEKRIGDDIITASGLTLLGPILKPLGITLFKPKRLRPIVMGWQLPPTKK